MLQKLLRKGLIKHALSQTSIIVKGRDQNQRINGHNHDMKKGFKTIIIAYK